MSDEIVAVVAPIAMYWITSCLYAILGRQEYRLHSTEEEEMKNLVPKREVIRVVLLQHLTQAAIAFAVFTVRRDGGGAAASTGAAPAIIVHSWQFMVAMAVFDTWQYFWHRLLHSNRFLYRHVHSCNHRLYNHPAESLVLDTAGGALALAVSGMSPWTSACFFSFATVKAIDDHSGMLLPGNPLHLVFANNTAYHDFHHQLRGAGCNYAQPFFVSWDRLMGTYVSVAIVRASHGGLEVVPAKRRTTRETTSAPA
ncbi:hypothetical protein BDA96_04G271100 [Sorghum bicolor]|uniref:aldehyde oxygenase (deformylating) n=2 Tax=Sorghum bicolor TaxID=4558 RepID=A0A921R6T1_SORBI|nr:hypothetical protein BDA96_04G271100 [Sorghum bicolor]KXG30847.1 hypothetical protein SORBI_3004G254200 [Sorghum bicolor]